MTKLPPLMQDLPTDKRGLPIPYVVLIDKEGTPHFKVNDSHKEFECIDKRLCHVCGKSLRREFWMIGGQISAFHPNGVFNDPPVHKECGIFSLQNCPYLINSNYKITEDIDALKATIKDDNLTDLFNPTPFNDRLTFFVLARTKDFTVRRASSGVKTIKAIKPYIEVEYWVSGERIHKAEALRLLKDNNEKSYLPK